MIAYIRRLYSRQRLRSAINRRQLMVPRHCRSTFGRRAFSVAAPVKWNSLPHSLRDPAPSTGGFRSAVKTHLLAKSSALEALRNALYKSTTTTATAKMMMSTYSTDRLRPRWNTDWPDIDRLRPRCRSLRRTTPRVQRVQFRVMCSTRCHCFDDCSPLPLKTSNSKIRSTYFASVVGVVAARLKFKIRHIL